MCTSMYGNNIVRCPRGAKCFHPLHRATKFQRRVQTRSMGYNHKSYWKCVQAPIAFIITHNTPSIYFVKILIILTPSYVAEDGGGVQIILHAVYGQNEKKIASTCQTGRHSISSAGVHCVLHIMSNIIVHARRRYTNPWWREKTVLRSPNENHRPIHGPVQVHVAETSNHCPNNLPRT